MFVDNVSITVKAGKGGDGAVAFRREKFVPKGGPSGGDGGRGGNIILKVDTGMRTLMDFRYRRHFKSSDGGRGLNKDMHGANAKDVYIMVPPGTSVIDLDSNTVIGDLTKKGEETIVAHGGQGGKGNVHFKTPRNTAPEIAENGALGEERALRLELKVLADVGLVGYPSVGKSTLLSVATSAKPKIAAYQFTTLSPNLGMVKLDDGRDFVMADLPGLIDGASKGIGLGFQFLRHIERTRVILHLVDMDPNNGRDPVKDYQRIRQELENYDPKILKRPQIIVASKMDIPGAKERLTEFEKTLNISDKDIYQISSVTHDGVNRLIQHTADVLAKAPNPIEDVKPIDQNKDKKYKFKPDEKQEIKVNKLDDGTFEIVDKDISSLLQRSNLNYQDGIMRFARQLRKMGVDDALIKAGAKTGDTVMIDDFMFEFV